MASHSRMSPNVPDREHESPSGIACGRPRTDAHAPPGGANRAGLPAVAAAVSRLSRAEASARPQSCGSRAILDAPRRGPQGERGDAEPGAAGAVVPLPARPPDGAAVAEEHHAILRPQATA